MEKLLGVNALLDYQLYLRAIIIILYAIVLFRANLSRLHGNHSILDFIIYIILGDILGQAIISKLPLLPTIIVTGIIVWIYRFFVYITYKNHFFGKYIKGDKVLIIKDGKYVEKNMQCCRLTMRDILQTLRIQHSKDSICSVKASYLERDGQISFIFNLD